MEHKISVTPEGVQVKLAGHMSSDAAELLGRELMGYVEKGHGTYLIDMSGLSSIGSAGLGSLITLNKRVRILGGSITVAGVRGHIKELFEMTMMHKLFEVQE